MQKTTFNIEGMMCPMCEAHVNDAVRAALEVQGIKCKKVRSSHKKGTTELLTESIPDVQAIAAAIGGAGYRVTDTRICEEKKRGLFR